MSELESMRHGHVVQFYESDDDLVAAAGRFLADGLSTGDAILVLATPVHAAALAAAMIAEGLDLDVARSERRYMQADAEESLAAFMIGNRPDPTLFQAVMGGLVATAAEAGRGLRVYGEMVGVLWAEGLHAAAIELEQLWNVLGLTDKFALYCGYPMSAVAGTEDLASVKIVCDSHSRIVTPPSYAPSVSVATAAGGGRQRSAFFVPVPLAAGAVRRLVADTLLDWGCESATVTLVASELATNAVMHARSPFRFSLSLDGAVVRCEVQDASVDPPTIAQPSARFGGRGMQIVRVLARTWGTHLLPEGKLVWAEVDVDRSAAPQG